jgi:hypothetical protein
MSDILYDLADLQKQATTERSHYYVAKTAQRAANEIVRLRAERDEWKEKWIALGQAALTAGILK